MSEFVKVVKGLCKKAKIVKEAKKVSNCLKENAWKVVLTFTKYLHVVNTVVECISPVPFSEHVIYN